MNVIDAAHERARAAVGQPPCLEPDGRARPLRLVIGDPQAPAARFFQVLAHHDLLGADGRLVPDALLISIGDHFDYKQTEPDLASAAQDGLEILSWLAAHPPDQVVVIAGNHDLSRVGELIGFDDETFRRAQEEAAAVCKLADPAELEVREAALLARFSAAPTAEFLARDMSSFTAAQRNLVTTLLRTGRMQLAWADRPDQLLLHAGISRSDLTRAGLDSSELGDARTIAAFLNGVLRSSVASWNGTTPLSLPDGLHTPGRRGQEGGGIVYHRPAIPGPQPREFEGEFRRRFDPRSAPAGLTQIVGHIQDEKCRKQMPGWSDGSGHRTGVLRHLRVGLTPDASGSYAHGVAARGPAADEALFLFVDGAMADAPPETYELLDLVSLRAFARG